METFAFYLLKSVAWILGFALVYLLFLRNERYFRLNRLFLLSGILASFIFPFLTVRYSVNVPAPMIEAGNAAVAGFKDGSQTTMTGIGLLLLVLYMAGALIVAFRTIKQSNSVLRSIRKAEIIKSHPVKLIRTADYTTSFSFFSYVFVNPSITELETGEIVNHELVHIRQLHWFDLVLVQLLCTLQWFNPFSWIYMQLIRQNHEYLADEMALQQTSNPAIYRAALLNQIVGSPVVNVANFFNYSLNKKRFYMMKNIITSPYRKMKIFLILPVIAIILFAFAKPDYIYNVSGINKSAQDNGSLVQGKELKGTVMQQDGKPLQGAALIIQGTTVGTISDENGKFRLRDVPDAAALVVSYVGFKSKVLKPDFNSDMIIKMVRDTIKIGSTSTMAPPPPPPPPPPPFNENGKPPLVVIDGKITDKDIKSLDQSKIESMTVLKDEYAIKKYGEKGKNGVLEITSKKDDQSGTRIKNSAEKVADPSVHQTFQKEVYYVVEEMPQFPGGSEALMNYIGSNIKYPADAVKKKITGQVELTFVVNAAGKIRDVKVEKSVDPSLDAEAVRVVSSMPDWKPGTQHGTPVDVFMKIPINFTLK